MYKISTFIPLSHLEAVKTAMFEAGAGRIGDYDCCCWQTPGTGQFRPLDRAQPFIGQPGKIESVEEYKVEMVCADDHIEQTITALKQAHPYEEPAYDVWKLEDL
ncbi:MAG: YqfO family protein [Gammaproteobacteria bacterium]|nr:YqfO family protein [Gammaproteobacteria bacterium]